MNPYLLAVIAGLCWGIGEVFTRAVLHTREVTALAAIALRSTVALPVLWLVWALARAGAAPDTPALLERASRATQLKLCYAAFFRQDPPFASYSSACGQLAWTPTSIRSCPSTGCLRS